MEWAREMAGAQAEAEAEVCREEVCKVADAAAAAAAAAVAASWVGVGRCKAAVRRMEQKAWRRLERHNGCGKPIPHA